MGNLTTTLVNNISSQIIATVVSPNTIFINIQEKITVLQGVGNAPTPTPSNTATQTPTPTPTSTQAPTPTLTPIPSLEPGALMSGVGVAGSVGLGDWDHYHIDTTPGTTSIHVVLSNLTADNDLYTRFDEPPNGTTWLCRPWDGGTTEEVCDTAVVHPRTLYIGVNGYEAGSYVITATLS